MAEYLLAKRRQQEKQIKDIWDSKGVVYNDRMVNRGRLNLLSHELGIKPTWNTLSAKLKDNDLSKKDEKELLEDIANTKKELKDTMTKHNLLRFDKTVVILESEQDRPPSPEVELRGTVQEVAMMRKKQNEEKQARQSEDNKVTNRFIAHQIINTARETPVQNEVFKEMLNCDAGRIIESQKDYLEEGHKDMYRSDEYQKIVRRRKNIKLCKDSTKQLSESERKAAETMIELDKDEFETI